jgi:heptosyltransferase-3
LGHDTGTLHLAAAVGTRIVGIYSARDVPGKWYSDHPGDRFFYNRPACFGCGLTQVADCPNQMTCMSSHSADKIVAAATEVLSDDSYRIEAASAECASYPSTCQLSDGYQSSSELAF